MGGVTSLGKRIILFMGAPGSGKGTQSSLLASRSGFTCVSTGAILRHAATLNTPDGFRLRQVMATGALVDDATVCDAVVSRIRNLRSKEGLILDGFPRTVSQAKRLDEILKAMGMAGPTVLHLDVPNSILTRRLSTRRQCASCGAVYNLSSSPSINGSRCELDGGALVERDDDVEGVVARRLAAYEAETLPVIEYYVARNGRGGTYRRLDGTLDPSVIAKGVAEIVLLPETALAA